MRIVSVQLKNIKSHRDTELTFAPGINVLSGANGCGKSTVFQAIGYALFGVSAQDFVSRAERFLTIGCKRGEISVVFQPADGDLYWVSRTVGPAAKWLLAKEKDGIFEVEEHANIQETERRIASLLGLSSGRPLSDQFKLVIGPFQNDFLGPFVIRQPTKRQDAFDEILGIDAWRKTFDGTKTLVAAVQSRIDTLQAETAGKRDQLLVLPAKELELAGLRGSESQKRAQLSSVSAGLEAATTQVAAMDGQRERIEAAQHALQELEGRIVSGKEHIATQQLLVEQSKRAAEAVSATSSGKKRYDDAELRLKELRAQEQLKLAGERKLAELAKEISSIRSALEIERRELAELAKGTEADTIALASEEGTLKDSLAQLQKLEARANEALAGVKRSAESFRELPPQRIEQILPYLRNALDRMAAIDMQCAERTSLLAGAEAAKTAAERLPSLRGELEELQNRRAQISGRRLSLIEGREKLGAGDCPFFHEPCQNLGAGGGVEIIESRVKAMDKEISLLDAQCGELSARVTSAQEAATSLAALRQVSLELEKAKKERNTLEAEFKASSSQIAPQLLQRSLAEWSAASGLTAPVPEELATAGFPAVEDPLQCREQLMAWSDGWHSVMQGVERQLDARLRQAEEPVQQCALRLAEQTARMEALAARRIDLAARAEKLQQREKVIAERAKRLAAVENESEGVRGTLLSHVGLEQAIDGAGQEMERCRPDRDLFIANRPAADELEKRLDTLAKYQARLDGLTAQKEAKRGQWEDLSASYDAGSHEQAKSRRESLLALEATLKAELAGLAEGGTRLEGEIAALHALAEEIERKLAAVERLKGQGALVKFLRNQVFKNVSSRLSERFREEISSRADRIYRCIANSDEELYWGENYQVVLKDLKDGELRERSDDQLSGGQMMSAVVALRLALLQTIGARIAFFDEPTSNLDAERRENLAKAFRAIDVGQEEVTEHWYDQLFLVSHDVSFTEITDQTIQLD